MKNNKGILIILGGIAVAALIIAWLMFGGEAPQNPVDVEDTTVNARVTNTTVSREQDGKRLWEFSVEELENISGSGEAVLKGVKGKIYREDGSVIDIEAGGGRINNDAKDFALDRGVHAVLSTGGEITAEKVRWQQDKDIIEATGKVKVVKDEHTALADKIVTSTRFDHFKLSGNAEVQKGGAVND